MSNLAWFIVIFFSLFIIGLLALALMVQKYYWGPRKKPLSKAKQVVKDNPPSL